MSDFKLLFLTLCMVLMVAGCDIGQFTQTKELDDYIISVTNDPNPITVGQSVKVYATLRSRQSGVTGCRVSVKQVQSHKEPEEAGEAINMPEGGRSGIYYAKSVIFPERGDWKLIFNINCAGREREVTFPYVVSASNQ